MRRHRMWAYPAHVLSKLIAVHEDYLRQRHAISGGCVPIPAPSCPAGQELCCLEERLGYLEDLVECEGADGQCDQGCAGLAESVYRARLEYHCGAGS